MIKFLTKYSSFVFVLAAIIIGFALYVHFFPGGSTETLSTETVVTVDEGANQGLLALLLQLHSITLDNKIFENATFKSLTDFSQELVAESSGRPNPFAPLGAVAGTGLRTSP